MPPMEHISIQDHSQHQPSLGRGGWFGFLGRCGGG